MLRTLYFDCAMGGAGDMLMGALLELHPNKKDFINRINNMLDGRAVVSDAPDKKCGICGTHISVAINGKEEYELTHYESCESNPGHHHTPVSDIVALIDSFNLPQKVKDDAKAVYMLIANAESEIHGEPVEHIHFHEVGTIDALADVIGVCMLINELKPERILASPINVGSGTVRCAHGVLPVPAPATEIILRGVPIYSGEVSGELCTPTGAALLKYFVNDFGRMPAIIVEKSGYGTGTKDFPTANIVRALLGEVRDDHNKVVELCCNIDDMTAEELGFAFDRLFVLGALDVYFTDIQMKKNRPGIMLTCMCREEQKEDMLRCIFENTTTIGVREYVCSRYCLNRTVRIVDTDFGPIRIKETEGYGVHHQKEEYEDLAEISRETGISILELKNKLHGK